MKSSSLFAAVLFASTALSSHAFAQMQQPLVEIEGGLIQNKGYGGIGVFLPFLIDDRNGIFFDASGRLAKGSARQASLGLGYRRRFGQDWVIGTYGYFDLFKSDYGNRFNQWSFGVEAIGPAYEGRANVYLPGSREAYLPGLSRAFVSGDELRFQAGREFARAGGDAEVGFRVPDFLEEMAAQVKVFGGAYWYDGRSRVDDIPGVKARTEITFAKVPGLPGATFALGASVSYDREDRTKFGLTARLRVPLGGSARGGDGAFDAMFQRVERASLVRTYAGASGPIERAEYVASGQAVGKVVKITSGSGRAAVINDRLAAGGDNALVLANGEIALDQSLQLGQGQHLLGGGGGIAVRGASSRQETVFRNQGPTARLTGSSPLANVVTMASGSEVASLAISGGLAGIAGSGASNLTIRDVDISRTAGDGIRLDNVTGALIDGARIHDLYICDNNSECEFAVGNPNRAPHAAISALGSRDLTIRDTAIDSVTYGIFIGSRIDDSDWPVVITHVAENISIDNVAISRSRREGVLLVAAKGVTMNKVGVDNSQQGLDMDLVVLQGTSDVTIRDMNLKGGINGLMLVTASTLPEAARTTNVRVDGLTVDGTRNAGIFLNPVSDIHFKNVSISNAGTYGAFIYGSDWDFLGGPVKNVSFENMRVDKAGTAGLYFMGPAIDIRGDVAVSGTPRNCLVSSFGSYVNGSLTQPAGSRLTLNGSELNAGNFEANCL
ncbi:right-handed parallel beta-helix repeat-containing protein [Labrys sp. KB_33_2]|uniref:right-handed parallel beta-helix repeat-containing protein n=1 Tax=Labrys sp. KB_33_2 TaxID=3237479 RepID=UPI003F90193E